MTGDGEKNERRMEDQTNLSFGGVHSNGSHLTVPDLLPTNVMLLFPMSVEEERKFWINLEEIFYGRTARK